MGLKIYHNPRCSKSRQALALLSEGGADVEVIEYLKTGLTLSDELRSLQAKSGLEARAMMRTGEAIYKQLDLKTQTDEAALLAAMVAHPILLERPFVVSDETAVICRPPELASAFL
jgi:arsenate reductase